ncbi:MAG TPA: hypothetical protein VNG13_05715 [Mycobacteriales bacterium]|nr:hypothetical protein [Mycobacteriales bacterium]
MTVGTRLIGSTSKPVPRAGDTRRRCPVCRERLSSYNPGPNCYAHTAEIPWRGPAVKPRS